MAGYPVIALVKGERLNVLGRLSAFTPLSLRGDYYTMIFDLSHFRAVRFIELYICGAYGEKKLLTLDGSSLGLRFDLNILDKPEYL